MTNKEWLSTLSAEEWESVAYWLYHDYGKQYTNSRTAIIDWLNEKHKPIMVWSPRDQKMIAKWM